MDNDEFVVFKTTIIFEHVNDQLKILVLHHLFGVGQLPPLSQLSPQLLPVLVLYVVDYQYLEPHKGVLVLSEFHFRVRLVRLQEFIIIVILFLVHQRP